MGLTTLASTPGASWESLGAADRGPLRDGLRRDQGELCAYCQRRLRDDDPVTGTPRVKIEHWHARSTHPERALEWSNLLAVCLGGAPGSSDEWGGQRHCDESRGSTPLFLHPVEGTGPNPEDHLRYAKDGVVSPSRPDVRVDGDITTLNLNADRLVRGRRAVFDALWERLARSEFSTHALRHAAREHRIVSGTRTPEYASFVRYVVLKKLRQRGESED